MKKYSSETIASNSDGGCGYNSSGVIQLFASQGDFGNGKSFTHLIFSGNIHDLQWKTGATLNANYFYLADSPTIYVGSTATQNNSGYMLNPFSGKLDKIVNANTISTINSSMPTTINSTQITGFCAFEMDGIDVCALINDIGEMQFYKLSDGTLFYSETIKLNGLTSVVDLDIFEKTPYSRNIEISVIGEDSASVQRLFTYEFILSTSSFPNYAPFSSVVTANLGIGYDDTGVVQELASEGDYNAQGSWQPTFTSDIGIFQFDNNGNTHNITGVGNNTTMLIGSTETQGIREGFGFVPETGNVYNFPSNSMLNIVPSNMFSAFGAFDYFGEHIAIFSNNIGEVEFYDLKTGYKYFNQIIKLNGLVEVLDIDAFQVNPDGRLLEIAVIGKDADDTQVLNKYSVRMTDSLVSSFKNFSDVANSDLGCGYNSSGVLQLYDSQGDTNASGRWRVTGTIGPTVLVLDNTGTVNIPSTGSYLGSTSSQGNRQGYAYNYSNGDLVVMTGSGNYTQIGTGYLPTTINTTQVTGFCVFEFNEKHLCALINDDGEFQVFYLADGNLVIPRIITLEGITKVYDLDIIVKNDINKTIEISVIADNVSSTKRLFKYMFRLTDYIPVNYTSFSSASNSDSGIGYNSSGVIQLYDSQGDTNAEGRWQITTGPLGPSGVYGVQNGVPTGSMPTGGASNTLLLGSVSSSIAGEGYGYVPENGNRGIFNLNGSPSLVISTDFFPTTINTTQVTGFCAFEFNSKDLCILINDIGEFQVFDLADGSQYFAQTFKLNNLTSVIDLDAFQENENDDYFEISVIGENSASTQVLQKYKVYSPKQLFDTNTFEPTDILSTSANFKGEVINFGN